MEADGGARESVIPREAPAVAIEPPRADAEPLRHVAQLQIAPDHAAALRRGSASYEATEIAAISSKIAASLSAKRRSLANASASTSARRCTAARAGGNGRRSERRQRRASVELRIASSPVKKAARR